jgi:hypothetical protein
MKGIEAKGEDRMGIGGWSVGSSKDRHPAEATGGMDMLLSSAQKPVGL